MIKPVTAASFMALMRGNPRPNNVTLSPCGRRGGKQTLMS
jgi:hypothetical protein